MTVLRTPLTEIELGLVQKLARVRFPPATAVKRFSLDLINGHIGQLSDEGRKFMARIVHRFRRQYELSELEQEWLKRWNLS